MLISDLGAYHLSHLLVYNGATALPTTFSSATKSYFATTTDFLRLDGLRELPDLGVETEIITFPVYESGVKYPVVSRKRINPSEFQFNYYSDPAFDTLIASRKETLLALVLLQTVVQGKVPLTTVNYPSTIAVHYCTGRFIDQIIDPPLNDVLTRTVSWLPTSEWQGPYDLT